MDKYTSTNRGMGDEFFGRPSWDELSDNPQLVLRNEH